MSATSQKTIRFVCPAGLAFLKDIIFAFLVLPFWRKRPLVPRTWQASRLHQADAWKRLGTKRTLAPVALAGLVFSKHTIFQSAHNRRLRSDAKVEAYLYQIKKTGYVFPRSQVVARKQSVCSHF
jgi:hypothetical protein